MKGWLCVHASHRGWPLVMATHSSECLLNQQPHGVTVTAAVQGGQGGGVPLVLAKGQNCRKHTILLLGQHK